MTVQENGATVIDKSTFGRLYRYFEEFELQILDEFGMRVRLSISYMDKADQKDVATDVTIEHIIMVVCKDFAYTPEEIRSSSRKGDLPTARQMICRLIKDFFPLTSYKRMGLNLGGRDHSTIIHSLQTFQDRHDTERDWRERYQVLHKKIEKVYEQGFIPAETNS